MFWALCFGFCVLGFVFCVLVLRFVFWVLDFCALGFGFCVLGFGPGRPLAGRFVSRGASEGLLEGLRGPRFEGRIPQG